MTKMPFRSNGSQTSPPDLIKRSTRMTCGANLEISLSVAFFRRRHRRPQGKIVTFPDASDFQVDPMLIYLLVMPT